MNPLIQLKQTSLVFVAAFGLVCFALSSAVQAVSPPPDGGYPNGNTAEGDSALSGLTSGFYNSAIGFLSLLSNGSASFNTGIGAGTLLSNTADQNTATGAAALFSNTTGGSNTANGGFALFKNTTGLGNTAIGQNTLGNNTVGQNNTALGINAGALVSTANNVLCIDNLGENVSETTWIGHIFGVTTQNGTTAPVIVSADGQLGTAPSSERFKKDIATMDNASEIILSLRPVTFHYRRDTKNTPQFGLIAEEVAKVNPSLVLPDKEGKPYTVRYDAVNAMLLNEFLKEHRKVEQLTKDFQSKLAVQQKQIEALTAGLQKVSAQLEVRKPPQRTVLNNQ